MATERTRRIVGSIIQNGRIFKAGDEVALAAALPTADAERLVAAGQLAGNWSAPASGAESSAAAPTSAPAESDETDEGEGTDSEEEEGLPPLAEMGDYLATIDDADELKALRKNDKRKGTKPMYKARLAELTSASEG